MWCTPELSEAIRGCAIESLGAGGYVCRRGSRRGATQVFAALDGLDVRQLLGFGSFHVVLAWPSVNLPCRKGRCGALACARATWA